MIQYIHVYYHIFLRVVAKSEPPSPRSPRVPESWTKSPASIAFLFAASVEAVQLSCRWMDRDPNPGGTSWHPSHLIQLFPTCQQRPWFASHGNRSLCPVLSEGSDGTCLPAMCETQSVHWSDTAKTQVVDCFFLERERERGSQYSEIYNVNTQKTPHFALRHCQPSWTHNKKTFPSVFSVGCQVWPPKQCYHQEATSKPF